MKTGVEIGFFSVFSRLVCPTVKSQGNTQQSCPSVQSAFGKIGDIQNMKNFFSDIFSQLEHQF